ncbi:PQQ-binding-like beta-propeller repeat protein [Streptomyces sp. NPDC085463]|uniref:serine/threonine-protein kinase n=1 Tax=Streptomyces sp. NPDC085463 TaxID=3365724 RepID=UPI0037D44E30
MLGPLREDAPRRIGPYEVLARLGAGGMGEVFLARGAGTGGPRGVGTAGPLSTGTGDAPGAGTAGPPSAGTGDVPGVGTAGPPGVGTIGPPGAGPDGPPPVPVPGPGRASAPVQDVFVAVKTVRRDVAGDPAFRDRFRREIKVASLVDSPYAAAPVGGDADAETPWLATAYVPGPSLSQAVRRGGALPVAAVRALGAGVARALADLHRAGVLHRDLKPGNVMLSVDGPRLIDFGIARSSTATTMTATGVMVGSPSFMSPEHVAGARRVTAASDVFCLGSLLCYAATGEEPFGDGPLAAVLYRVSRAEADLSRVPEELRGTVAACLAVDPAARPAPERLVELLEPAPAKVFPWPEGVREHIGEYGRELAQLVASGGPLLAAPAGFGPVVAPASQGLHSVPTLAPASPSTAPARRRPRRWRPLAAALALAVAAGGTGAYLLWPEGGGEGKAPAKAAGPRVPGVDDRGPADASGVVAQNAAQRPAGWRPWRAKLGAPAFGCSAGEAVVVCRTTDGRYEALDPADGKRLWAADLVEDPRDDQSFIGPTGGVFVAGGTGVPAVHGTYAVLLSGGRLQVRDARSGTVRWEKEGPSGGGLATRPVVAEGAVFVPTGDDAGGRMTAFALADGRELWSKALTNADLARVEYRDFEPVAAANGLVYAMSDAGFVAYDARTSDQRGQVPSEAKTCDALLVRGRYAYCAPLDATNESPLVLHRLDAVTLSPVGPGRLPVPAGIAESGAWPAAVSDRAAVVLDAGPLRWANSGNTGEPGGVYVLDPATGRSLGHYPAPALTSADGRRQLLSNPLITGSALVYADFSALRVVPLGADGRPGKERVVPVPGAPGPRAEEEYDRPAGTYLDREVRPPQVLPLGGVAHVVYDTGVVVSVGLPREALGEAPAAGEKE